MTLITLTHTLEDGTISVESPYNRKFIDDLKEEVPAGSRLWDKDDSCWKVDEDYQEILEELLEKHYENADYDWYEL